MAATIMNTSPRASTYVENAPALNDSGNAGEMLP
jgi:hypothetical protein